MSAQAHTQPSAPAVVQVAIPPSPSRKPKDEKKAGRPQLASPFAAMQRALASSLGMQPKQQPVTASLPEGQRTTPPSSAPSTARASPLSKVSCGSLPLPTTVSNAVAQPPLLHLSSCDIAALSRLTAAVQMPEAPAASAPCSPANSSGGSGEAAALLEERNALSEPGGFSQPSAPLHVKAYGSVEEASLEAQLLEMHAQGLGPVVHAAAIMRMAPGRPKPCSIYLGEEGMWDGRAGQLYGPSSPAGSDLVQINSPAPAGPGIKERVKFHLQRQFMS